MRLFEEQMNALILDEDTAEVRRLVKKTDWEKSGIIRTFTAYSIEKAEEVLKTEEIAVFICGLTLNKKETLTMLSRIREKMPYLGIIVLGTITEPDVFRSMLKLRISDCLEKPVNDKELEQDIKRMIDRADLRQKDEEERRYGKYWKKNYILIQEVFWKNLCLGRIPGGPEEIEAAAAHVNAPLDKDRRYRMILITLKNEGEMEQAWGDNLCQVAVQNLARAISKKSGRSSKAIVIYTRVVLIADEDEFEMEEEKCMKLAQACEKELGAKILCYLSDDIFCEEFGNTYSRLLEYSKDDILQQKVVTWVKEKKEPGNEKIIIPEQWGDLLYSRQVEQLVTQVRFFLVALTKSGVLNEKKFRIFQQDMLQLFFTQMEKKEMRAHELYDNPEIYRLYKLAIYSIDSMCIWVEKCGMYITGQMGEGPSGQKLVGQIKDYIRGNLRDEITMEELSQITHLNPDYMTRVFKRETGISIKKYVIKKKMELAKQLLQTTEASVSEIALEVGYDNFSYFIKLFQKHYGITPKRFRKKNGKVENLPFS